jgi:hypothetical protein
VRVEPVERIQVHVREARADLTVAERVAEAKAIKEERDAQVSRREERERAEAAEKARLRAENIAAGLLGACPVCRREVETADGIVLSHQNLRFGPMGARDCEGIGEDLVPIET